MGEKEPRSGVETTWSYSVIAALTHFYSESTREWARKVVEQSVGKDIIEVHMGSMENHSKDPFLDGKTATWSRPDRTKGANPEDALIPRLRGDRTERGLRALTIAFDYRCRQYSLIVIALTACALVIDCLLHPVSLGNFGIILDVLGATIVARGILRTPDDIDKSAMEEGILPSGQLGSVEDRLVLAAETIDAMLGTTLLATGFLLQFLDSGFLATLFVFVVLVGS